MIKRLNQIEESEYKHPNEVYKVPVQTNFLNHFVMAAAVIYACHGVVVNHKIQTYTREYVETMETGDEEEKRRKIRWTILIL